MKDHQTAQELHAIVETVVRERFPPGGVLEVRTRAGLDHDGDPVIRILVVFPDGQRPDTDAVESLGLFLHPRLMEASINAYLSTSYISRSDLEKRDRAAA